MADLSVPLPHPLKRYLNWFDALPDDLQSSLALQMVVTAPSNVFEFTDADLPRVAAVVKERVRRGDSPTARVIGLVLLLRELTEWAFVSYGTKEARERGRRRAEEATAAIAAEHGLEFVAPIEAALRSHEFRSRMFIREYEGWHDFRSRFLSSEFLEAWATLADMYETE